MVLPSTDQQTPPAIPLRTPQQQSLEQSLVEMQTLLEQHGHVVVVYSSAAPAATEQRLRSVRSILESDRIALFKSDLPPLGLAVLIRQMRQLSVTDLSAGVVASAGRLLTHYIHAGAVLNTVAKLDRVPVSLKSHAKSWMPGKQFGVVTNPAPQLVEIGPEARLAGPEFGTWLLVAKGQLQTDWISSNLANAWSVQGLLEAELPAESARWWGTGKLVEFATFLPDLSVLYQLVTAVRRDLCHWCGLELIGDRCVFCSVTTPGYHRRDRAEAS
ncbi:hypothetical protein NGF19_27445 [Streptomyces sp. RY43-2]|uniref:Uncharacterized protein n=1 Tax=Streptomyces macrolidinus TaxID=2952607 RepID=A0ABT0ZLK0_9ACTN|nr:hypothetical protein [Streptomyces macrolidinus]MCN9244473.1 hypothetical protein [Streptomyces macrolidinus]